MSKTTGPDIYMNPSAMVFECRNCDWTKPFVFPLVVSELDATIAEVKKEHDTESQECSGGLGG